MQKTGRTVSVPGVIAASYHRITAYQSSVNGRGECDPQCQKTGLPFNIDPNKNY
jgi:hypothetical protein